MADPHAQRNDARRLLLLSNSRDPEGRFLTFAAEAIRDHLRGRSRAVFAPYAGVTVSLDAYADRVAETLSPLGVEVSALHRAPDPIAAVQSADAIIVGGGNTFQLLRRLGDLGLLDAIRERVRTGVPYLGWSAGAVVSCPTIRTTNDMPIVEPRGLAALGLVPFQINAHYTDAHPAGHQGETRAERIAEFVELNRAVRVIGLREGSGLRVHGDAMTLIGISGARLFAYGREPVDIVPGSDVSDLLAAHVTAGSGGPA